MSIHYLKIEVTKYISSLLRIFKTARENPTISWFNKEIQMTMPLVASTINNQLVFLFLCLVAAGGAFIWQKNQSMLAPFWPLQFYTIYTFSPKRKSNLENQLCEIIPIFSQDPNLLQCACTYILRSDSWIKSKSFRAGYSVYAFYSFQWAVYSR